MTSREKLRPRSSSQRAPDRMPDVLPSSDRRMPDTARQIREIRERRAAIEEESRRLDEKESALSKNPLIRRLTSARSSVRQSKKALNEQLKEMEEEERRINAQLEREKMRTVKEDDEEEHGQIDEDELSQDETIILRRGRSLRASVRRKSVTDIDDIIKRKETEEQRGRLKADYAHEAGEWSSHVRTLIDQIAARPTSYFLFKQLKNDDMPKLEEKLFCFAVKFVDQDRLAAEEDLQLRALYLMWKEFKEVVDTMEKRMMQSVDLETEEVAVDADSCTDESSGDEVESTLAPTETTDSESHVQRACDYAREAEDFKRRVDQIMEEITEHPSTPPADVSLKMITKTKQVELPALSTSLGRLLDMQAECDDDDLQWGALKIRWTRLRDAVNARAKELKELCEVQQSAYTEEADCFRSRVNQIKELITSTPSPEHNEALTMIRRIKSEDLPAMEQHLDRLLELLVECSYDGQQWPFETLVQEFTQLINTVKTREFQLLEQIGKKLRDEDSSEENNSRHDKARNCEEESEQNVVRWRTAEDHNGTGEDQSQDNQSQFERQSTRLSFHRRLHSEMEQTFKKKGMAAAAEVDEEEDKIKSRPFDISREIEEEMMRCLAVKEMRVRMEEEKIENEKNTAKMEFDMMRERWEELKKKRMEENKLEEEKGKKEEEERKRLEEEKKKRIEEENRKKEEEERNKRIEEEKMKRMEDERRKKEEEERIRMIEEEMKKLEEERRKKEEEEKNKKIEEDKLKKLKEERRKKEEEEMRRLEDEKEKRMEEKKKYKEVEERDRRIEEEKMKKMEEERRKKEEEEKNRKIEEEKLKRLEEERRKKEEEKNIRIEEEKKTILEVDRRKKEEEEEIKKMMELERRKNDQAEKIKKLDEDMKKKKEEIARVQNQLLERQKAAMDKKKAEEARRRSREEKRLKDSNSQVERQADRPRDPSQQRQLLQTELQQKLKTTPLGKAVAAELEDEQDRERKRKNEMRRERDEEERRRAELELARRKDEDRGREAEKLETTRRQQEHQNVSTTSSTNQRQQELEKRLKEMEQEALKRLADEMAALKKEFGLDGAASSVGTSMRRTVSDEHLPQHSAPINTAPPATISHDPRSCLRAGVRERTPLNRASSRPRSVTFGNAQGSENIIAELTRSPSFRRRRAAHASDDESEPEHQQSRF